MNRTVLACGAVFAVALCSAACGDVQGRSVDTADCRKARELLATGGPVAELPAAPPLPRISGTGRSTGHVIPPSADPAEVPAERSDLGLPDAEDETIVEVAVVEDEDIAALRDRARDELAEQGWSPSEAGRATSGGELTSFALRYERGHARGTLSTVSCSDEPSTLLYLEQRQPPDG